MKSTRRKALRNCCIAWAAVSKMLWQQKVRARKWQVWKEAFPFSYTRHQRRSDPRGHGSYVRIIQGLCSRPAKGLRPKGERWRCYIDRSSVISCDRRQWFRMVQACGRICKCKYTRSWLNTNHWRNELEERRKWHCPDAIEMGNECGVELSAAVCYTTKITVWWFIFNACSQNYILMFNFYLCIHTNCVRFFIWAAAFPAGTFEFSSHPLFLSVDVSKIKRAKKKKC